MPDSTKGAITTNTLVMLLLGIGVVGVFLWMWHELNPPGLRSVTDAGKPSPPPKPKPPETARRVVPPAQVTPKPEPLAAKRPEERVFPTAESVPVGMDRSELLEKFGKPSMVTTSVEQGQELETLVYMRRGPPRQETVVVLKDSSVVSAHSR